MSTKRDRSMPAGVPPSELTADTFEADGDEFVLFSWPTSGTSGHMGTPTSANTEAPAMRTALSAAEADVLARIVNGASNREIANGRGVSERTVANQVASLLRKLGARSRFELIRRHARA